MDVNNVDNKKDGDPTRSISVPSVIEGPKQKVEGSIKKKRRRGKSKRKILKPFMKIPWQDRRKNDKTKRNNRFRTIVLAKTQAPFNNNQFLMEIHKPEPENNFHARTPSARTRDSSFSVDSEDNYFFSLPEDEEEYLTKEFSSVYEDAQSERLSNMSKNELIQEYLLLEAKYDNLIKRTERIKPRYIEDDKDNITEKDTTATDSMVTDKDTSTTSFDESSTVDEASSIDIMQRMKEQEDQIIELQLANEKLRLENDHLRKRSQGSSSEDSESDSSSTSVSSSSNSNRSRSPVENSTREINGSSVIQDNGTYDQNGVIEDIEPTSSLVNGFHDPSDT